MIQSIRTKHIKGNTIEQQFTGRDIFIGPNGSGKSTRLQAVQLAMLGYIPGKGKTMAETFKLSSGESMTAGLKLDNFNFDRTISRSEKLKGDGKTEVKYNESLSVSPNKGEKNATEMNARVTAEIGSFPVVFDFQEFLNLSDAKRREFIYELSPISNDDWDKDKVTAHIIKNLLTPGLKETSPDLYDATQELINDAIAEWPDGYDLSAGLQSMIAWVTTQQQYWNKKKDDATGAVRELAEMKNQLEETDRDIVAKKNELQSLRSQHIEIHGQITAGREIKRQWDEKQIRIGELRSEIEQLTKRIGLPSVWDYDAKVSELQTKIKHTDVSAEAGKIQGEITSLVRQRDEKTTTLDQTKAERDKFVRELDNITSIVKQIEEKSAGICVISPSIGCDKDFSGFTNHVAVNKPKLEQKIAALNQTIEDIKNEITTLRNKENELETQKQNLYSSANEESRRNEQYRKEIEQLRNSEQEENKAKIDAESKRLARQEELDRLLAEKPPAFAPLELLEPQHSALELQIKELERLVDEKEKAKITLSNAQTAMISASKAQYNHAACKNLSEQLGPKGIQGELVKAILGPVESSVSENLRLMAIEHPAFFSTKSETGKEVFQFGWIKDGYETNFDVLSTGEQLMFLSAFLVTLLERKNPPMKVLALDNIENLDKKNFRGLLNGLNGLAHKLDNILVAGVVDEIDVEGWKFWNLSSGEVASL